MGFLKPLSVAFLLFVAIVVIASIGYAYIRNREMQKTIRLAIEKSTRIDAAMIDKLVARKSVKSEDYYIGGIVCAAAGVGFLVFGYFLGRISSLNAFFLLAGSGIMVGVIGVGLIFCGMLLGRREKGEQTAAYPT